MSSQNAENIANRAPVASALVGLVTFISIYGVSYFTIGGAALIATIAAVTYYFRPRYAPFVIIAFLAIPIYEKFIISTTQSLQYIGGIALALLGLSFVIALKYPVPAMLGLWLGMLLAYSIDMVLVIPAIAAVALFMGRRHAIVTSLIFSFFGVFFLVYQSLGHLLPLSFTSVQVFFPTLSQLTSIKLYTLLFSIILGPSWSSILASSPLGTFLEYIPLFFIVFSFIMAAVIPYSKRLTSSIRYSQLLSYLLASIISLIFGFFISGSMLLAVVSAVALYAISILLITVKPLLGNRPRFKTTALKQLFEEPAVVLAKEFEEKEGVVIDEKPSASKNLKDSWDKLMGVDEVKTNLMRAVAIPMKYKDKAKQFGVKPVKGILLYGPPGTGKSTILKGLAAMLDMKFIEINAAEIMSKWYGESEQKVKKVFDDALASPPCFLAIDEIDSIGRDRSSQEADPFTPRLLNLILMGMDRIYQSDEDIVVVATTNKPQLLDKALLRPGRFESIIYMGPPDEKARAEIFRGYLQNRPNVSPDIDYAKLAKMSERFTGADIESVVNKVFSGAFFKSLTGKKDQPTVITQEMLEEAIKSTRPSITFSMLEEYERFRVEFEREKKTEKVWESEIPDVRFSDIGDLEDVKQQLREAFELPITRPDLMEKLRIKPVKGVLLYGPPGNGKTMLAKAIATEISANFFTISGADLAKGDAASAAATIKDLFNVAKDNSPAIIFIDEIDQVAPNRSRSGAAAFTAVTTQLLSELDGIKELKGVFVLAATNKPEDLDPALLRANRLEKHIEIPYPNAEARKAIFEVYLKDLNVKDVDVDKLVQLTEGFSGADIQELVNEAKKVVLRRMMAKKDESEAITMEDFMVALKNKTSGKIK